MSGILFSASVPGVFAEEAERTQKFSMATRHFHESYELYFLLNGERFYFIEQDTYLVKSGMAVLVNKKPDSQNQFLGEYSFQPAQPFPAPIGCFHPGSHFKICWLPAS